MICNCQLPYDDFEASMRWYRNRFLAESDWTQMPDNDLANEERQAWAAYRSALRHFPETWEPGPTADFPDPPNH